MALFTDSSISNLRDLEQHDSAVLEVARIEGVELSSKMSLAEREMGLELQAFLVAQPNASEYSLAQIVATPALKHWHALRTLAMLYGDVYNSQLNDRYKGKWHQYAQMAKNTAENIFLTGVGLVLQPLARAGQPSLVAVGGSGAAATYVVSIAWRNSAGSHGAPSDPKVHELADGQALVVMPPEPPLYAVSFDVYAGVSVTELWLQSAAAIDAAEAWTMPAGGLVAGPAPGDGQAAEVYVRRRRILQRG